MTIYFEPLYMLPFPVFLRFPVGVCHGFHGLKSPRLFNFASFRRHLYTDIIKPEAWKPPAIHVRVFQTPFLIILLSEGEGVWRTRCPKGRIAAGSWTRGIQAYPTHLPSAKTAVNYVSHKNLCSFVEKTQSWLLIMFFCQKK